MVASFAEAARNSGDQAQQGELDKAAVKSVLTVAGYATGIPAAQIKKTLDAIEAARDGEDVSVLDYLTGPPRDRSEEHTSELQSLMRISYAVFCLKKKTTNKLYTHTHTKGEIKLQNTQNIH